MTRFKHMPVTQLVIDHDYQRPLDEARVARIVREFRPAMLGVLEVSQHNGKCAVFDGQHRLAAVKELGRKTVPCLVHEDLSKAEEAELFYRLQRDRKAIHPVQVFRARCVAGDEETLAIRETVSAAGFSIGSKRDVSTMSAVKTLERIYRRGTLADTLRLLRLWEGDDGATDGMFIAGVALLHEGYGHRLGAAERQKLAATSAAVITRNALSRQVRVVGWSNAKDRATFVLAELRSIANLGGRPVKRKAKS